MKALTQEEIQKEYEILKACRIKPAYFEYFYQKYFTDIFHFVYRRVSEEALAEDLCSEVFLKALQKLEMFQERGLPFSAWLYRIALNEVNMYYRKSKRDIQLSLEKSKIQLVQEETDGLVTAENLELLAKAFSELPEKELRMIEMRFFDQMPFKEIGEIFGMTENNAKVKVYRIMDRIKKQFPGK